MYQPFQQQPSGYPPQQQQPQQMSPPAYPATAQPYQAQPVQPFQAAQPYQAQPVQPFQAQQAPGPIAPDRESYQSVLPPSVTPGWNDPPAILPTGHGPNRLTAMRRRPVDPSISGSGYGAPQAVQQPQGQPGQYGYGQQPQPLQQQQGYQAYGQQYQQGAHYQQQQY